MSTKEQIYDEAEKLKDAGELEEAAKKLEESLALDPDYALAHSALAIVFTKLTRHDDAIRHAQRVVELEPRDFFSYMGLSVAYQRAGKIPEAETALARSRMVQQGMI